MSAPDPQRVARFAAALGEFEAELNWRLLESLYVEGPSEGFFGPEQIAAQRDTALLFAADFAEELPERGRSLYVGVGVAEVALLLFEQLMLEREVRAVTLPGAEAGELRRALEVSGERLGQELPRIETRALAGLPFEECDHLWFVSVVSDPTAFPALHRKLYAKSAPKAKPLTADLARAQALLAEALRRLAPRSLVHVSDEEFELMAEQARQRGRELAPAPTARYSAVVGDPVRACRLVPFGRPLAEPSAEPFPKPPPEPFPKPLPGPPEREGPGSGRRRGGGPRGRRPSGGGGPAPEKRRS